MAIQTNEFQQYVDEANTIFFRSGIHFDWDAVADVDNVNNTLLNRDVSLLVLASSLNNSASPPQEDFHNSGTNNSAARSAYALTRPGQARRFRRSVWEHLGHKILLGRDQPLAVQEVDRRVFELGG